MSIQFDMIHTAQRLVLPIKSALPKERTEKVLPLPLAATQTLLQHGYEKKRGTPFTKVISHVGNGVMQFV